MEIISIGQKFDMITRHYDPKIIAELNGQEIKAAKLKGDFVWHKHDNEDELFYVIKGKLLMHLREKTLEINEGEMIVIPKGVEHCPSAPEEVWLLLFEPASTLNTGNVVNEMTKEDPGRI